MEILSFIGLILAVVILTVGAFRGLGALPLTILASLVVILTSQMPIWGSFSTQYMGGYTTSYLNYFLLFVASSLYAELMNVAGTATSIGMKFIDWFGKDRVLLVSVLLVSFLTYGGVSLFVVIFAVAPILFMLFEEADIPRHLTIGVVIAGAATFTMTTLPGSPQLTNVIPTQYLGTTLNAAPILSIITAIIMFGMIMFYLNRQLKLARERDEHWENAEDPSLNSNVDQLAGDLPNTFQAFAPIIVLLLIIILGSSFIEDSTMLATIAMLVGSLLVFVLNVDKFKDKSFVAILNKGTGGGISAIGGLAAVVAFGGVVQASPAFDSIVEWLLNLDVNPYLQGVVSTAAISGVTGSSSGGLLIMFESLSEHFLNMDLNRELLHRMTSIAAGSWDTLPHSPGLFVMLPMLGLTHKDGYRHIFAISVIIPSIVVIGLLIITLFV